MPHELRPFNDQTRAYFRIKCADLLSHTPEMDMDSGSEFTVIPEWMFLNPRNLTRLESLRKMRLESYTGHKMPGFFTALPLTLIGDRNTEWTTPTQEIVYVYQTKSSIGCLLGYKAILRNFKQINYDPKSRLITMTPIPN